MKHGTHGKEEDIERKLYETESRIVLEMNKVNTSDNIEAYL